MIVVSEAVLPKAKPGKAVAVGSVGVQNFE
jgi:hypothetical protein